MSIELTFEQFLLYNCHLPLVTIGESVSILLSKDEVTAGEILGGRCVVIVKGYGVSTIVSIIKVVILMIV